MSDANNSGPVTDEYLSLLKTLAETINSGDIEQSNVLIGELIILRETSLFNELGMLTREIHESINAFSNDHRVAELAEEDIPDAKERLSFIVTKTDEAAHRTMTNAEQTVEIVSAFNARAAEIHERWMLFKTKEMSKQDFLTLTRDIDVFLASISVESEKVKGQMTDIMMAQDYQDLTGQMIKQVTNMVQEIEGKLVRLVAITGAKISENENEHKDGTMAHGPQLATANKAEVATNQDEVDDLLASLGF